MRKITECVKRHKETINAVGIVVAVVALVFLGLQTYSLRKQTQLLAEQTQLMAEQTQLLAEQYKATFRPSLGVENITIATQEGNNSSLDILIEVKNYGQVPATKVDLEKVIIGGADVQYDEKTGYTFIYTSDGTESPPKTTTTANNTGVSINVSGFVVALINENYPPDIIFFPGQDQVIIATVDKPTYEATVSETKVMHVALLYSSGLDQYYCVAKATLQDDIWKVIQNRGN